MASTWSLARAALCGASAFVLMLSFGAQTPAHASATGDSTGSSPECPQTRHVLQLDSLSRGLSAYDCGLVGHIVRGRHIGAAIPRRGLAVHAIADGKDGSWEELIVATSRQGELSVRHNSSPAAQAADAALLDNACQDPFQPPITWRQAGTLNWRFNLASAPANISGGVYSQIRAAANNISSNFNNCGVADGSSYSQADAGTTSSQPNINADANCTDTDTLNVFAFGALNDPYWLAVTCTWYEPVTGHVLFSDQRFDNSDISWTVTPFSGCSGQWDVQSVATHEHGHSAGMQHANETDHPWFTMSPEINGTCQTAERTFGLGEANAWNAVY